MGIRPKADGENIILTDTHRELVDDATATTDEFGTALGEGINEIYATAQSANSGAQELAGRVKRLEEYRSHQVEIPAEHASGQGWVAHKWGRVVTLFLNSVTTGFNLPDGFAPAVNVRCPLAIGSATVDGRFSVSTAGAVSFTDAAAGGKYGVATYLTK